MLLALVEERIHENCVGIVKEAKTGCSADKTLFTNSVRVANEKGVRQSDSLSPKLFRTCLDMVFRKLNWEDGVSVNGKWLNHLRIVEDMVFIAKSAREVNDM